MDVFQNQTVGRRVYGGGPFPQYTHHGDRLIGACCCDRGAIGRWHGTLSQSLVAICKRRTSTVVCDGTAGADCAVGASSAVVGGPAVVRGRAEWAAVRPDSRSDLHGAIAHVPAWLCRWCQLSRAIKRRRARGGSLRRPTAAVCPGAHASTCRTASGRIAHRAPPPSPLSPSPPSSSTAAAAAAASVAEAWAARAAAAAADLCRV